MGKTAKQCRLGLFQDSDFAGDLEHSKSTSGGTLCVFGSPTFVPVSWMWKKQTSVSHSSTESEIISLDTGLRLDGIPALELWDLIVSGSFAVFIEQGSSAPKMTAKVMDVIAKLPGCAGQAADAVSAGTQVQMDDAPKFTENSQSRNAQTFGFVYHDTNGQNHGPVWKTQSFLLSEICMVILWQDCYGKVNLRKSY